MLGLNFFLLSALQFFMSHAGVGTGNPVVDDPFRVVKEIKLSDEIPIGTIGSIDVNDERQLLIADPIGRNVMLFDWNGALLKVLSAEACDPGLRWQPGEAYFRPDGSIIVLISSPPWGVIFSGEGECIQKTDESFLSPKSFCVTSDYMFALHTMNPDRPDRLDLYIQKYDYNGKSIGPFADLPDDFAHVNHRSVFRGLVCDEDGTVYVSLASGPELFIYNSAGELVNTIREVPSYYRAIREDVAFTSDLQYLMRKFKEINNTKTLMFSIFKLNVNRILMQFRNNSHEYGVQVIDVRRKRAVNEEEIIAHRLFYYAGENYIYAFRQADINESGELPNPSILVYELAR